MQQAEQTTPAEPHLTLPPPNVQRVDDDRELAAGSRTTHGVGEALACQGGTPAHMLQHQLASQSKKKPHLS